MGYSTNNSDGNVLQEWASTVDLRLLHDYKQRKFFHSATWNTFISLQTQTYHSIHATPTILYHHPVYKVEENFPKSRPSSITPLY